MKNTFGSAITMTLFGESHGAGVGVVLDGIAPGIRVSDDSIRASLLARRPSGAYSTSRVEKDEYQILSGVLNQTTTGAPLTLWIPNTEARPEDYTAIKDIPRPSHSDYTASVKYHGYEDKRGGGHFSGRLTAPIVAVGAILEDALRESFGIEIGAHIFSLGDIRDERMLGTREEISHLKNAPFPTLCSACAQKMEERMREIAADGDSIGGIVEGAVIGIPAGVGEPFFDSVESILCHLLFSIGGVKGVEFGDGFAMASRLGSEANDPFAIADGRIVTTKNASGGIQGGITNGMPILVRTAIKPTPSIHKTQKSVDLGSMKEVALTVEGRHDGTIVHRALPVSRAMLAFGVADLLTVRYGTDALAKRTGV